MSDPQPRPGSDGTDRPDIAESSDPGGTVTLVRWWVAALAGLGGLVIGMLIAALLLATTPRFGAAPGAAPGSPDKDEPTAASSIPVVAEARVNAACLRVINEAQDVVRILSGADEAVTDVDLQRLDDIVRRLQPVEARLQRDLLDCRVDTSVSTGSTTGPSSPVPTMPQPSGTPR